MMNLAVLVLTLPLSAPVSTASLDTPLDGRLDGAPATGSDGLEVRRELLAQRDQRPAEPSSGLGFLIPGAIMTGVAGLNLATAPVCRTDFYVGLAGRSGSDICLVLSLVVGGVLAVVGIPLLVIGILRRGAWKEWNEKYGRPEALYDPVSRGIVFGWAMPLSGP